MDNKVTKNLFFSKILFGVIILFNSPWIMAANEDAFLLPKVVAVENKLYEPKYDLTLNLGFLPLDAFYKAVTGGFSYTYSMNSYLAWEILNGQYASVEDTGLKLDLLKNFNARPAGILDSIQMMAVTSLVYTPIYLKSLFFNETLRHGTIDLIGSLGTVGFNSGDTGVLFGGGVSFRFFKSQSFSYKFDTRLYSHTAKNKSADLILAILFGFSFEFSDKKSLN